jgi:hypothetical protein
MNECSNTCSLSVLSIDFDVRPRESTWPRYAASHHFIRHPLNLRHVVVVNGLLTAVIPFDGYARPIRFSDGALIGSIVLPANTVADVKLSGLFASHRVPSTVD